MLPPRREPSRPGGRLRALWLAALLTGCWGQPADPPPPPAPTDPPSTEPALPPVPDVPLNEPRYAATHVLVAFAGAVQAHPDLTRTQAEARALAMDLHRKALAGEDLEALARAHSDGPSAPRGGVLGVYAVGTMIPEFEKAVASVDVGEIAPIVRSPFGFHVIRRDPVQEWRLWHVQIAWDGAWRSAATRTRDEARARAEEVLRALQAGQDPDALARQYSDDPSAERNGGDLGLVARGQLVPAFEEAAFALKPGETSDIVESPYGFHIIRRLEPTE